LAITLAGLCRDPLPSPLRRDGDAGFDVLILEDAERISEADFLKVARRARRWVLIGEVPREPWQDRDRWNHAGLVPYLWHLLHWDPRQLPFTWRTESDRLCCRLRPVAPAQRRFLENERLADSPEIELRILALPQVPPTLVEVVF